MTSSLWLALSLALAFVAAMAAWLLRGRAADRRIAELAAEAQRERDRIREAQAEAARLPDAVARGDRAEAAAAQANAALRSASASEAALQSRLDARAEEATRLGAELAGVKAALEAITREARETATKLATAEAQRDATAEAYQQAKAFLAEAQEKLRAAFTDAASQVFDEKARLLDAHIKESGLQSKRSLAETLQPFANRIEGLQSKIELLASEESKERATLVGALGELKTLNQDMADATNGLTRALRSNSKVRGQWGELILETVLKASGLVEGMNFTRQAKSLDDDSGQRRFADVVVTLPDGRSVVVDSKVNLVAWAEASDAETPEAHNEALVRHAAALRLHMRDLSEKNYPKTVGPDCLEMTVLFVPIEGALSGALTVNPDLQMEAFEKRVVFASPNTLMAMLQVIGRLWTRDKLQRQVAVIGAEAGKLIDAITALLEEFDEVGKQIVKTDAAFRQARHRLVDSNQSVAARARRLVEAGAKGRRQIPEDLAPLSEPTPLLGVDPGIATDEPALR